MKLDEMFPSKYLKASDVEDGDLTLTIDRVEIEAMENREGEKEQKPVLFFREHKKGMVMNRTNAQTISNLHGGDTDGWIGQRVILTAVEVTAFGETKPALRISSRKPTTDKKTLLAHYQKLFERARAAAVDNLDDYAITPDIDEQSLIEAGKELRRKVEAAEAFN